MVGENCSYEWLSERLHSSEDGVLLLDCRSEAAYRTSHVRGSIHVVVPSILMRRLKAGSVAVQSMVGSDERQRFADRWKSDNVVLYDDGPPPVSGGGAGGGAAVDVIGCGGGVQADRNDVVSLLMGKLRTDGCRVCYLQGGFAGFHKKYGHLCVGEEEEEPVRKLDGEEHGLNLGLTNLRLSEITQDESNLKERHTPSSVFPFPVEVMPYLFLGNAENSADLSCLNQHGIRYVLNVTPDIPNTFLEDKSFKYLQIPIPDNLSQNLTAFFPSAIAFIDEARSKNCGVLVHCRAGISRSVTVTMAYLMVTKSLSLEDAYEYLRECKPNISPNFNFMGQLLDFENVLRRRISCTCNGAVAAAVEGTEPADAACTTCRNTKTYFSSLSLEDHPRPVLSPRMAFPTEDHTCSVTTPLSFSLNKTSSSSPTSPSSLSSLTSEATDST